MKKIIILLIILLILCGCEAKKETNAKLSEEYDTTYFEYDNKKYTKNDVYQRLKAQSVSSAFEAIVAKQALDAEGFDFETKRSYYEEQYDMIASMYGEEMVVQYYGEKDDFVDMCFIEDATSIYLSNYVDKRLTEFINQFPTQYVEYITTSDKKKAEKFQKLVSKGSTFDEAIEKTEFENNEYTIKQVYSIDEEVFPESVNNEYINLEVGKVSKPIEYIEEVAESSSGDNTEQNEPVPQYYVIRIISVDPENEYKDEFISYVITSLNITSLFDVFSEDHQINLYDDDFVYTYNQILSANEQGY